MIRQLRDPSGSTNTPYESRQLTGLYIPLQILHPGLNYTHVFCMVCHYISTLVCLYIRILRRAGPRAAIPSSSACVMVFLPAPASSSQQDQHEQNHQVSGPLQEEPLASYRISMTESLEMRTCLTLSSPRARSGEYIRIAASPDATSGFACGGLHLLLGSESDSSVEEKWVCRGTATGTGATTATGAADTAAAHISSSVPSASRVHSETPADLQMRPQESRILDKSIYTAKYEYRYVKLWCSQNPSGSTTLHI